MLSSSLDLSLQVYALSKERDALRRGSDKLSSAAGLLKEKDDIIQQARAQLPAAWACRGLQPARHLRATWQCRASGMFAVV